MTDSWHYVNILTDGIRHSQGEMRSDRRWRENLNSTMIDEGRKGEGGGKGNENTS